MVNQERREGAASAPSIESTSPTTTEAIPKPHE